jgi:hypothetical protein
MKYFLDYCNYYMDDPGPDPQADAPGGSESAAPVEALRRCARLANHPLGSPPPSVGTKQGVSKVPITGSIFDGKDSWQLGMSVLLEHNCLSLLATVYSPVSRQQPPSSMDAWSQQKFYQC